MKKIIKKGKDQIRLGKELLSQDWESESRWAMIQMLIPLGLMAVEEDLEAEVSRVVGDRYSCSQQQFKRWGHNTGYVYLGDQKVSVSVPRVRDVAQVAIVWL